MLGFNRKAKEREAKRAGEQAAIYRAIRTAISDQLHESITWLVASHALAKSNADALIVSASKIQKGFDAVLVHGVDAHGPELFDTDPLVKGGAMVAQAAGNLAVISGRVGNPNIRGDVFYMLGFSRDGSARRDNPASETSAQGAHQKIANAVDKIMERLVTPWADNMIDTFTKKVAAKLIFCDDLGLEAQSSLVEFNQVVNDHLEATIIPDVKVKLSAYERPSDELSTLLINRFDTLRQKLAASTMEIAQCVIIARNEELGFDVEKGPHLINGRRILKEARAMPVSLTEDEKKILVEGLLIAKAHGKTV
jgi:hypothetical protein